jgi:DNA polymerase-3 subunit delta
MLESATTLQILSERWGDTPISIDELGRAQEFSLRYAVIFTLVDGGGDRRRAAAGGGVVARLRRAAGRLHRQDQRARTAGEGTAPRHEHRDPAPHRRRAERHQPKAEDRGTSADPALERGVAELLRPDRLAAQLAAEPMRPAYLSPVPKRWSSWKPPTPSAPPRASRASAIAKCSTSKAAIRIGIRCPPRSTHRACSHATRRRSAHAVRQAGQGRRGVFTDFCADPPPDVVLLVTCADWSRQHGGKWSEALGAHRPYGDRLASEAARVARLDRTPHARAACAPIATRCRRSPNASKATCSPPRRKSTSSPCSPKAARSTRRAMEALVSDSARYDVFRLVDAAMNGQGAQVARMLQGLRAEGEAVPALLGMVTMELQRAAALSRVQARGGNLHAEFKAQRIWDSKQAAYTRALQRHDAARWERFAAEAGRVDRIAKGARAWGRIRWMPGSRSNACCSPSPNRARCACWADR